MEKIVEEEEKQENRERNRIDLKTKKMTNDSIPTLMTAKNVVRPIEQKKSVSVSSENTTIQIHSSPTQTASTVAPSTEKPKDKSTKRRTMVHWRVEPYRSQMVQAIYLVRKSGMSTKSVAERFNIPPRTLRRYVSDPSRLGLDIVFPEYEKRRRRTKVKNTVTPKSFTTSMVAAAAASTSPKTNKTAKPSKYSTILNIEWEEHVDDKNDELNQSRRWSVEPYRSQMVRAIGMIQRQGISMSRVASICGIPTRTLRRYVNNTIKMHKILKDNDGTSCQTNDIMKGEVDMSSVMDLMSLGNLRTKKQSRSNSMEGRNEIEPSGRYHHLASPRSRSDSSSSFESVRGLAVGWKTRKRSLSSESLELRGKQLQAAMTYSTMSQTDAARQLLRIQKCKKGDHVMICLDSEISSSLVSNMTNEGECKETKSSTSLPRWVAGEISNVRFLKKKNNKEEKVYDVTYGKEDEKKTVSILESKNRVVNRNACGWSKHPCGVGFVKTLLGESMIPTDSTMPSLMPNDSTISSIPIYMGRNARQRSRAMSWSVGDDDFISMSPRLKKARSSSMEDPRIVASAFILTQIACPPL